MEKCRKCREHLIASVEPDSIAAELGIEANDVLLKVNDKEIVDFVDYSFFTCNEELTLTVRKQDGEVIEYAFEKDENEPLGIQFENDFMDKERPCRNKCVFCFIDQMPKQMRQTLYFKDDDWRLSMLMGNYVTFTNIDDKEIDRIIERKAGPIYVSVHATDKDVRALMLGRGNCDIMPVLRKLADGGITYHCQIVLCPGLNDGAVLENTLNDLYSLGEHCGSVAIVPVGMTKFREGLYKLEKVDFDIANRTIDIANKVREKALAERGTRFVFVSDEIYIVGKRPIPDYEAYESFDQIEDGIGMYAMFANDFREGLEGMTESKTDCGIISGTLIADKMQELLDLLPNKGARVLAVENDFFGNTITVTGLLTGKDIVAHIKGCDAPKNLFISNNCLRRGEDVFLDGMTLQQMKEELSGHNIEVVSSGYELANKLRKK